jgi:hypothetical protein
VSQSSWSIGDLDVKAQGLERSLDEVVYEPYALSPEDVRIVEDFRCVPHESKEVQSV